MPRPRKKAQQLEEQLPSAEQAPGELGATSPPTAAASGPDVFDEAIAARQQAEQAAAQHPHHEPGDDSHSDQPAKGEWESKLPDPFPRHGVELGNGKLIKLYRSNRWQQLAIQFTAAEGIDPKPDREFTDWLGTHGWTWRYEDRVWTKQFLTAEDKADIEAITKEKGKEAGDRERSRRRSRGDEAAHLEFVELTNLIREHNGLEPVIPSFGPNRGR